ncbi:protein tesmin/TSO1-like CXC 2 [Drosophila eugracilis]|uniref:protein tesmin/TSO1-like CXC 2 n=1 Tax=Drosophila eugracilis TaxID=29029 RepID=UPI001BDB3034|nr:protein tesmin/TSO1-like CXC 2 [Drosophila eugracilis]
MTTPKTRTVEKSEGKRTRGQGQSGIKGCCCKRSQCIKNYCDCYQSMAICTKLCRCIGCRNTEVRKLVDSNFGGKNSTAAKRQKAAAMSAKAAAAAAKEGIQVPMKVLQAGVPVVGFPEKLQAVPLPFVLPASQQPTVVPIKIVVPPPIAISSAEVKVIKASVEPITETPSIPVKLDNRRERNLFVQPVNCALLDCMIIQAMEAEELGLMEIQVCQLVLVEFMRGYKEILEKICEYNKDFY